LIEGAKVFYVEGYFLTHGLEPALELSKTATNAGKVNQSFVKQHQPSFR
jgi:adenosine kinase